MINLGIVYPGVLLAMFAVCFYFAVYFLNQNLRIPYIQFSFAMSIALCAFSFGQAMCFSEPTHESVHFWRFVSIFGWVAFYTVLFRFTLYLTQGRPLVDKRLHHLLLYIPALMLMIAYAFIDEPVDGAFYILRPYAARTGPVWTRILDIAFIVYYAACSVAGLAVVWRWRRKQENKTQRSLARTVMFALAVTLALEILFDSLIRTNPSPLIVTLTPLMLLIPLILLLSAIRHYSYLRPPQRHTGQLIMNPQTGILLYHSLGTFFLLFGLANIVVLMLSSTPAVLYDTIYSTILSIMGLLLIVIQTIKTEQIRQSLNLYLSIMSIPIFSLMYMARFPQTYWVYPFLLVILSLVYSDRSRLLLVSAGAIVTQAIIWLETPVTSPLYAGSAYILRITFYTVILFIGWVVNRIYLDKLKETTYRADLEKMISDISSDFAHVTQKSLSDNINELLSKTGSFFGADRSFIFMFDDAKQEMTIQYEWHRDNVEAELGRLKTCPYSSCPNLVRRMTQYTPICLEDVKKLSADVVTDNELFLQKNIVSFAAAPIFSNNTLYGFHGMTTYHSRLRLTKGDLDVLRTLAGLVANRFVLLQAERDIAQLAYYDTLTGLPNRITFSRQAAQAIKSAGKHGRYLGFIFVDLNNFKTVNDTLGHNVGDDVLKSVTASLLTVLRKTDTVCRFDSDKFIILLNPVSGRDQINDIANRIIAVFESPLQMREHVFFITANAGISVYPDDGNDDGSLIKNADLAMNRAKAAGPNRFEVCTEDMKKDATMTALLSNSLFRAVNRGELFLHYQPIVDLKTNRIRAVEALVRWNHPELGPLSPSLFIPLAEKNGLIGSIGEWVLKTACIQNARWHDEGLPDIDTFVNLSAMQFYNPRLADTVKRIVSETNMNPDRLVLEITESAAVREMYFTSDTLQHLRDIGVSITIDDFGTEYSSLNRLKELPIDRLKIDMQFVQGLEKNEQDRAIVVMIINLAKNFGLQVTAEGIETASQLQFLKANGCDEGQGYYFSRPRPPHELEHLF